MARHDDPAAWSKRQTEILNAAEAEFAKRGLNASKLADIARAARVSEGAIFLYFEKGKDSLFDALLQRHRLISQGNFLGHPPGVLDASTTEYGIRLTVGAEQYDRIARVLGAL